jgi:hypothetical protein
MEGKLLHRRDKKIKEKTIVIYVETQKNVSKGKEIEIG